MYNMEKAVETAMVSMQWHGAPTRVLVRGEGAKRDVGTGDVVAVSLEQARELVKYSHFWTVEGDTPTEHGFEKAQKDALAKVVAAAKAEKTGKKPAAETTKKTKAPTKAEAEAAAKAAKEAAVADLTAEKVEAMATIEEVMAALESVGTKVNPDASLEEMKSVLMEVLTA